MFTFRSFSRYIQGESQDTAQPTSPATQAWTSQSARKRNLDACIGPSDGPNKRRSPSTREEPVTAAPLDVTPEPDDDYLCRPDPEKNWGDHRWDSRIVSKLIAASSEMIALSPEGRTKKFFIHKELLCYYSPYYRTLLSGRWEDGKRRRSFVAETTQPALALFVKWLYTNDLTDAMGLKRWDDLAEVYTFAAPSLVIALQRDIIDTFLDDHLEGKVFCGFDYATIANVYRRLPSDSPLINFIVHNSVHHWTPEAESPEMKERRQIHAPVDFLLSVMEGQAQLIQDQNAAPKHAKNTTKFISKRCPMCRGDFCDFHAHESQEERAATCCLPIRSREGSGDEDTIVDSEYGEVVEIPSGGT